MTVLLGGRQRVVAQERGKRTGMIVGGHLKPSAHVGLEPLRRLPSVFLELLLQECEIDESRPGGIFANCFAPLLEPGNHVHGPAKGDAVFTDEVFVPRRGPTALVEIRALIGQSEIGTAVEVTDAADAALAKGIDDDACRRLRRVAGHRRREP